MRVGGTRLPPCKPWGHVCSVCAAPVWLPNTWLTSGARSAQFGLHFKWLLFERTKSSIKCGIEIEEGGINTKYIPIAMIRSVMQII